MKTCTAHDNAQSDQSPKQDVYASITAKIVAAPEAAVRPWVRPWNAEHAAAAASLPRPRSVPRFATNIDMLISAVGFASRCLHSPLDVAAALRRSTCRHLSDTRETAANEAAEMV
jgi:hypothetical protein